MASFCFLKLELGSRRLRCGRRRRWRREFGVVHGNVLLNLLDLDGESVAWARQGPAERHLQTIYIAIIRIVDLRWVAAEGSFGVPHKAQQQPDSLSRNKRSGGWPSVRPTTMYVSCPSIFSPTSTLNFS